MSKSVHNRSPARGVWGHAPTKNILGPLRCVLVQSELDELDQFH